VPAFDAHVHVFGSEDEGLLAQGGERRAVLDAGRIGGALLASALPVELWRRLLGPGEADEDRLLRRALRQNLHLCEAAATDVRLLVAAGADPTLPSDATVAHLEDLIDRFGVRALKIHPALNFVLPSHPGYRPIYELAVARDLVVLSHGGSSAGSLYEDTTEYCAPEHFAPVLHDFPGLRLVVAHLAHPFEDGLLRLGRDFPNLRTDLSFVLGAGLLTAERLAATVEAFGADRVLFGSDFPYFDPTASLDALEACGLEEDALAAVTARNATALFGLG
jgi:predicted TIM-barrel fold metal-dependent hydrolase